MKRTFNSRYATEEEGRPAFAECETCGRAKGESHPEGWVLFGDGINSHGGEGVFQCGKCSSHLHPLPTCTCGATKPVIGRHGSTWCGDCHRGLD